MIDKKKARQDSYVLKNMKREPRIHQMVRHPHIVVLFEVRLWVWCCSDSFHKNGFNTVCCVLDPGDREQLLHGHGAVFWRRPDGQDLWEEAAGGEGGPTLHQTDPLCGGPPAQTWDCAQVRHRHPLLMFVFTFPVTQSRECKPNLSDLTL